MHTPSESASIEEIQAFFANDHFATDACGCTITEASRGHAVCEFTISEVHLNGLGGVMGGAIFTLADLALAVACNVDENPTVAVANNIRYLNAAKGRRLIATADVDKSGRTMGYYTVRVEDELGTPVAVMGASCYRHAG